MGLLDGILKKLAWGTAGVVALATLTSQLYPSDVTHEIQAVGARWVYGGEILYVQVWSNFSPQTLFFGALYDHFIAAPPFFAMLFEVVILGVIALCIKSIFSTIQPSYTARQSSYVLAPLLGLIILAPGLWQRGVTPVKLATVFFCLATAFYYKWRVSEQSYWLLGSTTKNFRYLLLTGVFLSLLIFTNPWLSLLALPFLYDTYRVMGSSWKEWLRWASLLILPMTIELWVWYSVLAPRHLLGEAYKSMVFDRYVQMANGSSSATANIIVIVLALGALICTALPQAARQNATKKPFAWFITIVTIVTMVLLGTGSLVYVPLFACCAGVAAMHTHINELHTRRILTLVAVLILPILVQRFEYHASRQVESLRLDLASSYALQRSGTNNRILYFGKSLGFYSTSGLSNPTPFYNMRTFSIDEQRTQYGLESQFRGSSEADASPLVIVATSPEEKVILPDRLVQYLNKHYVHAVDVDGYTILKRL